ncbi:MAG: hypothetical protein RL226_1092 [Bacteroidota bacterium]|jgi:hypothetical protein
MSDQPEILDFPEEEKPVIKPYTLLRGLALNGIIISLVFRLMHWPGTTILLLISLSLWTVWSVLHFLANKRVIRSEAWYFTGRSGMILGILFTYFDFLWLSNISFIIALIAITIGWLREKYARKR